MIVLPSVVVRGIGSRISEGEEMLLRRGFLCVCNRALCAFVPGLFVRRQQAGFLGVMGVRAACGCGYWEI